MNDTKNNLPIPNQLTENLPSLPVERAVPPSEIVDVLLDSRFDLIQHLGS